MQYARDLAWLLLSAPLFCAPAGASGQDHAWTATEEQSIRTWLAGLSPTALAKYIEAQTDARTRPGEPRFQLGRYAEVLLKFFLQASVTHELVAANVRVRGPMQSAKADGAQQMRDLGELDFLVRDRNGAASHWELATKFFLYMPADGLRNTCVTRVPELGSLSDLPVNPREALGRGLGRERPQQVPGAAPGGLDEPILAADFVGPNGNERMIEKWQHLYQHQLQLAVPEPFAREPWPARALTRGRLFYPLGMLPPVTAFLHPEHGFGFWLELQDLHAWFHSLPAGARVRLLDKADWLAPLAADGWTPGSLTPEDAEASVRQRLAAGAKMQLLAIGTEVDGELCRGWVLAPEWRKLCAGDASVLA
jgi:hypothetical protein